MGVWDPSEVEDVEELLGERLRRLLEPGERLTVRGLSEEGKERVTFVIDGGADGSRLVAESEVAGAVREAARDLALDALDMILMEHLESGRSERPTGVWEERELGGQAVRIRLERMFPSLEEQADLLLRGG